MVFSLDVSEFSYSISIQHQIRGIFLAFLYIVCILLTLSSRKYDELMAFHFDSFTNLTHSEHFNASTTVFI